jgi:hypothetical protein
MAMPLIRTLAALVSLPLCWASRAAAFDDDWRLATASEEVAVAGALIQSIAGKV